MKYLVLAYGDRQAMSKLTPDELAVLKTEIDAHDAELKKSGHLRESLSLEWDSVTIRPRAGKAVVTDGPFLETKEQVGGLVTIEARDLNEAVRVASLHPAAHVGEALGCGLEVHAIEHALETEATVPGPRWLLLCYGQREPFERQTPAELQATMARCNELDAAMRATGHYAMGEGLSWDAMTIRPRKGKPVVTDGPFLETKDLVGGLVMITARDKAEAIRLACMHPAALTNEALGWAVELRPIAAGCHQ